MSEPFAGTVDFVLARRLIERTGCGPMARDRATATFIALFDYTDGRGVIDAASGLIAADLEITRATFLTYRTVLEQAGLLDVSELHGGVRRTMQLVAVA